MTLEEFMSRGSTATMEPPAGSMTLDEFMGAGEFDPDAVARSVVGTIEEQQAERPEGMSAFERNVQIASERDQEGRGLLTGSAPYQIAEGAVRSAAGGIVEPMLAAESALGFETAGDMLADRQFTSDVANARDQSWGGRMLSGAAEGVAQAATLGLVAPATLAARTAAAAASFGQKVYGSSYREAKNRGMTDEEAAKIARSSASLEGGIMAAFSIAGLGGFEQGLFKGAGWQGAKKFFGMAAVELPEELITAATQSLASRGDLSQTNALDVTAQTILSMGALAGIQKYRNFIDRPSRSTAKALGIEQVVKTEAARKDLADKVRMYHGGVREGEGPAWLSPSKEYAEGYARKTEGGKVYSIDLPKDSPLLKKSFDDEGTDQEAPYLAVEAPAEVAAGLQEVTPESSLPSPNAPGIVPGGVVSPSSLLIDRITDNVMTGVKGVRRWITQTFSSGGELNPQTRKALFERQGKINGHFFVIRETSKRLAHQIRQHHGSLRTKKINEGIAQELNAALAGGPLPANTPQGIALSVQKMRDHIDVLSQEIRDLPGIEDSELAMTIDENMGVYVTRTYKKFGPGAKRWKRKALKDKSIMGDFTAEVLQENPTASPEEIRNLAETLLNKDTVTLADVTGFSPRTQRYVDVMKKRKDLSPAVRRLYGERKDIFENYSESVARMASLVAHKQFIQGLKETGLREGFFSPAKSQAIGHTWQVNSQLPQLRDLADVYTTEDVADSLNDLYAIKRNGKIERSILAAIAFPKAAKTVLSWQATVRNFTGNIPIALRNGVFNPKDFKAGADAGWNDLLGKGDAQARAKLKRYHELNLVEGVNYEALADAHRAITATNEDYVAGIDNRNHFKGALRNIGRFYQHMDSIYKIATYEHYLKVYQEADPAADPRTLEYKAAQTARSITPTHSEASKAAKFWSRYAPWGPFAMFSAEMYRTSGNAARLMTEFLASGNPALQKQGAKMAVGHAVALAGVTALAYATKEWFDVSDEEEEAVRQRLPPWQKNSPILFAGNPKDEKFDYYDGSYNDPFSVFTQPAIALLRGEPVEALREVAEPFMAEDLAIGGLLSILRNKDALGRRVYDPGLSDDEQNKQLAKYAWEIFEPGTITSIKRIGRGARWETSKGGKEYDATDEVLNFGIGVKRETMDREQSEMFRNRDFERQVTESNASIRSLFLSKGSFDVEAARQLYQSAEGERKKNLEDWRKFVDGSIVLGEENPYAKVARDIGGESTIMKLMYSRQYRPYAFNKADLRKMLSLPQGAERVALYQELAAQ